MQLFAPPTPNSDTLPEIDFRNKATELHPPRSFRAGQSIVDENSPVSQILLIVDGIAATYKSLLDGKRRIMSFHFPGDIANLQCGLGPVTYGICALIDSKVSQICPADLEAVLGAHPEFLPVIWRAAILKSSVLREQVWSSGQHASFRVAHLLCEFLERYKGNGDGREFLLPLTQAQIGDACGLSSIHVNRVLRRFRPLGVGIFTRGQIRITDVTALQKLCCFRNQYLYHRASRLLSARRMRSDGLNDRRGRTLHRGNTRCQGDRCGVFRVGHS